ncbi:TD and POZ domain-containing protein 1 [Araneus ventricosus]|uniref:TD and POZ domain-containing protein 1 n=1 Tax=Araneus ventricosus TaxID=182803 RepID=A0A4Y2KL20_ARAVE|nr:TD and POZ domain-containing protein 1 [Araneus ventricosus]
MASRDVNERKCFTFIWKIENASYFWQKPREYFSSPSFVVHEIEATKWKLNLYPSYITNALEDNTIAFCLVRQFDSKGSEKLGIEWQVGLLASDGTILSACCRKKGDFRKGKFVDFDLIPARRADVFHARRREFLSQGTLLVSCKIWKSVGEMAEDIQWVARTCLAVEKRSFTWKVGHFSALESEKKYTYEIKSLETGEQIISLDLFLTGGLNSEEIRFAVTRKDPKIRCCMLELSPVDAFGNAVERLKDEFLFDVPDESKQSPLCLSKAKLKEKNKVLSLLCMCGFSAGVIMKEIERVLSDRTSFKIRDAENLCFERENEIKRVISDSITTKNSETKNHCLGSENVLHGLKNVLINDFKSMLNERIQSDIQLRTRSKTYPSHKCILSARSPVFKAMFSNDMKEKINDSVDIPDLNDDTVFRMLQYIYSAEVEELEWRSAIQLYEAADKYEILTLRDECSSYLKNNLCRNKACEALVLADLHQDEGLKSFVQDFIVRQGKDIVFSKEWDQLMETDPRLAAETMRLKYKE